MAEVVLHLPKLSPHQKIFTAKQTCKYRVVAAGTKAGKTFALAVVVVHKLFNAKKPIQILWAAPFYSNTKVALKYIAKFIPTHLRSVNKSDMTLTMKHNGATLYCKPTNSDPEAIEGEAYNYVILDEASKANPNAIASIRTTTTKTKAPIVLISTPRGKNWFYEYYMRGLDPNNPDFESFNFKTIDNPFIDQSEIEIAKRELPEFLFRQYYLAEFTETDSVFGLLDSIVHGPSIEDETYFEKPVQDREYVIGVDLAKKVDYSVITVMDKEAKKLVGFKRMQGVRYVDQIPEIKYIQQSYNNAALIYDATGVGTAVEEFMDRAEIIGEGFVFTNERKAEMINKLILATEYKLINIPNIRALVDEMKSFECTMKGGKPFYSAPTGQHDDCVISLALANSLLDHYDMFDWDDELFLEDAVKKHKEKVIEQSPRFDYLNHLT